MSKPKQAIRILVADDHAIFRDGLRKLLEASDDTQIIGEAANGVECAVVDLQCGDQSPTAVLRVRGRSPEAISRSDC